MLSYPCSNFNTTFNCSSTGKSKKPRYINTDESITKTLTASTLKVYLALRFEIDFKKNVACIKKSAQEIADAAGIGRTRTFRAFNELENHGLLQRQETKDRRTTYWIAKELEYFTKTIHPSYNEQTNTSVHDVNGTVHNVNTYQYSYSEFNNMGYVENNLISENEHTQFYSHATIEEWDVYSEWQPMAQPIKSDYFDKHATNNQTKQKSYKINQKKSLKQRAEDGKQLCINDEKCIEKFDEKLSEYEVDYEDVVQQCFDYYWFGKGRVIYPSLLLNWIKNQCPKKQGYKKKHQSFVKNKPIPSLTMDEESLIAARRNEYSMPGLICMNEQERKKADELILLHNVIIEHCSYKKSRGIRSICQGKNFPQHSNLIGSHS